EPCPFRWLGCGSYVAERIPTLTQRHSPTATIHGILDLMRYKFDMAIRWLVAAIVGLGMTLPAGPGRAQSVPVAQPRINIDTPTDGDRVGNGTELNIGGWAVDLSGPGIGIDEV